MEISLTVVIPALNEAENIEAAIIGVQRELAAAGIVNAELLVMTCLDRNGQHDGTVDIVRRLAESDPRIRSVHVEGYQKLGEKYRQGVQLATKDYVMMIPGDNENDPASFRDIFRQIGTTDMVLSYTPNPELRPLHRRIISRIYTFSLNILFGHRLKYYNGVSVYPVKYLRVALPKTDSFAYAAEIVLNMLRQGRSYIEVPARVQGRCGPSKALRWDNLKKVVATISRLWVEYRWKKSDV
jgi:glycosyltransferase involved in cell wall biosynthesis